MCVKCHDSALCGIAHLSRQSIMKTGQITVADSTHFYDAHRATLLSVSLIGPWVHLGPSSIHRECYMRARACGGKAENKVHYQWINHTISPSTSSLSSPCVSGMPVAGCPGELSCVLYVFSSRAGSCDVTAAETQIASDLHRQASSRCLFAGHVLSQVVLRQSSRTEQHGRPACSRASVTFSVVYGCLPHRAPRSDCCN